MKTGERWSSCQLLVLALLAAAGCVSDRAAVEKNLMARQHERSEGVAQAYRAACPDVVELEVPQRPEFTGRYQIAPDGRIDLGDYGKLRIEGRTIPEIAKLIAEETGVGAANVRVEVREFKSQRVLLFGEVNGSQRSVPYCGPETVLDLLQRVGGVTPGAAPNDVYVIRPHVGDNRRPEVFHVDLGAIVLKNDERTNLRVQPFDQIYVGETFRSKVEKAVPPLLLGVYHLAFPATRNPEVRHKKQETADE